jgi:HlyD family secretion protein
MRKWLIWSVVLVAVVAVGLRATVLAPDPVQVRVVPVERASVEATVTNTKAGTVRARRRALISAEIGGRIVEIAHREGDEVEGGALLIRLNDATHTAQIRLAEETLRVSEASRRRACIVRDRAKRELARNRALAEKAIVSADLLDQLGSTYETANAACSSAGAEVDRAKAQIAAAEVELEKTVIRAPFKGVIAEVRVEVGEWVTPSPPLLTAPAVIDVIDPSSTYISAPMDEVDSASIHAGQPAKVTVDSHPGVEFAAEVVRVAPYVLDVEAQNRTVEIEVEIGDRELAATLLPGTSADVEVVLQVRDGVLRVPTSALLEDNRVLVPEDGTLVERAVRVGLKNWDYAEVLEGLEAQDRVVISLDRAEVQAGARVEVEETEYRP